MPLFIRDDETVALVAELAKRSGASRPAAVKTAVEEALRRLKDFETFDERLADFYATHPMPPKTGLLADKTFFDDL